MTAGQRTVMRGALDVPHEVVRLRGTALADADDLPRALDLEPDACVVVRCYVTDLGVAAALVHAGAVADPTALLDALGARTLRPATADEVNLATDYAAGLVSPFGLPPEVLLVADAALLACEVVYCPLGESGVALGVRSEHLLGTTGAAVAGLSVVPLPEGTREPWTGASRVVDLDAPDRPRRYAG